jgi:hypothetical protein
MRFLLACCLVLFGETAALAENSSKAFVEDCKASSKDDWSRPSLHHCYGVIGTMMAVGPFLTDDMRFCPTKEHTIFGVGVMNRYVKAHPDALNSDGRASDRIVMLILAFREEWPCK